MNFIILCLKNHSIWERNEKGYQQFSFLLQLANLFYLDNTRHKELLGVIWKFRVSKVWDSAGCELILPPSHGGQNPKKAQIVRGAEPHRAPMSSGRADKAYPQELHCPHLAQMHSTAPRGTKGLQSIFYTLLVYWKHIIKRFVIL